MGESKSSEECQLTPRQVLFAKNLVKGMTITDAARNAGYSGKNLAQSGHQALKAIRLRMPELMDNLGLSVPILIEKHLKPKLAAKETKFFHHHGKIITRRVEALGVQMQAIKTALKLHGAYEKESPNDAANIGVKVVVQDMPRHQRDVVMPDILAPVQPPNGSSGNGYKLAPAAKRHL